MTVTAIEEFKKSFPDFDEKYIPSLLSISRICLMRNPSTKAESIEEAYRHVIKGSCRSCTFNFKNSKMLVDRSL